jgi:hypothetical protein
MKATRLFLAAIAVALAAGCTSEITGPEMPRLDETPATFKQSLDPVVDDGGTGILGQGWLGSGH